MHSRRSECEAIVRRLWPYVDNQLPDSEMELVTLHLEQCDDCLSHFDFALAFLDAVRSARPAMVDDDALRARVLAALTSQGFLSV